MTKELTVEQLDRLSSALHQAAGYIAGDLGWDGKGVLPEWLDTQPTSSNVEFLRSVYGAAQDASVWSLEACGVVL